MFAHLIELDSMYLIQSSDNAVMEKVDSHKCKVTEREIAH